MTKKHEKQHNMPQEENGNRAFTNEALTCAAIQKVNEFDCHANLPPYNGSIVPLDWTHLQVGSFLGSGTFAAVYKVQLINAPQQLDDNENDATLAIKVLRPDVIEKNDKGEYFAGAVDLAIEARMLASLQHDNIVRLHGVNMGSFEESLQACDDFLVLDYLVQTLGQFLAQERTRLEQKPKWYTDKIAFSKRPRRRHSDATAIHHRLQTIAKGIVRAMEYMHSHDVVFRDLKPSNVGFDARGQVKVFDLGLARPLHFIDTGRPVGSPRYMAPEVALCEPYGLSADVYSFGILLWEICSLQKPFSDMLVGSELRQRVAYGNERPSLDEIGTGNRLLKMIIRGCWQKSPRCRPSFTTVLSELNKIDLQERRRWSIFGASSVDVSEKGQIFAEDDMNRHRLTYLLPTRRTEGHGGGMMKHFWQKVTLAPVARQEEEELVFDQSP